MRPPHIATLLKPTLVCLLVAAPGAAVFYLLNLPLPFLLGPMVAVGLAGPRLGAGMVNPLRDAAFFLLGLQIGASFTPESADRLIRLPVAAVFLILSTAFCMWAGYAVFRRIAGWDRVTSFLASAPGALSTVLALTSESPANMSRVMLAQTVRLVVLIIVVPIALHLDTSSSPTPEHWGALDYLIALPVAAIAGALLSWRRLPAAWVLGPSAAIAALTATNMLHGYPHPAIFATGLFLVGAATGLRLAGGIAQGWHASLLHALTGLVAMLAAATVSALIAAPLTGIPLATLLLAFAPGGFEVMIAMSLAFDLDPAFVSAAHISRVLGLTLLLPVFFPRHG